MSRVEENEKFVANVPESFSGSTDQVLMREYAAILGALVDISKSLAIIADYCNDISEFSPWEGDDGK